jgi:transcriptional regulator with XRE-family HTH domain
MITISKNIKRFRQKMGWSQRQMAEQLKISVPAFSKIESGITDINIKRLTQIALVLDTTIMDLMAKDGESSQSLHLQRVRQLKIKLSKKEEEIINLQKQVIELHEQIREQKEVVEIETGN